MTRCVKSLMLKVLGVSEKAVGIAEKVLELGDDPNVISVEPEAITKLVWKIKMEKPFENVEEVEAYLNKHEIPFGKVFDYSPNGYMFEDSAYHPDNVRGVFC